MRQGRSKSQEARRVAKIKMAGERTIRKIVLSRIKMTEQIRTV